MSDIGVVKFHCIHCGQRISTTHDQAGSYGDCPSCKEGIRVPGVDQAVADKLKPSPDSISIGENERDHQPRKRSRRGRMSMSRGVRRKPKVINNEGCITYCISCDVMSSVNVEGKVEKVVCSRCDRDVILVNDKGSVDDIAYILMRKKFSKKIGGLDRGQYFLYMLLGGAIPLVPVFLTMSRIKNYGGNRWFSLLTLVPIVGLVPVIYGLVLPPGYNIVKIMDSRSYMMLVVSLILLVFLAVNLIAILS